MNLEREANVSFNFTILLFYMHHKNLFLFSSDDNLLAMYFENNLFYSEKDLDFILKYPATGMGKAVVTYVKLTVLEVKIDRTHYVQHLHEF